MHVCNSGSAFLVNAEVDSMGGVVDGGVGIGLKTSPRRAAIAKAQAELRQEYDVREERRRQLEFLEKGGNPLDFKFGNAASVSVQSTSLTDQHHDQFVTSEAKGSFALTASPHGDSVDSSARPGAPSHSEPNTADNLLLFDGENELPEGEKRSLHSNKRNNIAPSEQSSQIGGSQNAKETEDSAIFRPYARRNRSRSNHGPRGASREGKGSMSETTNSQKDPNVPSVSKPKSASLNGDMVMKNLAPNNQLNNELVGVRAHQSASGSAGVPKDKLDITLNRNLKENHGILPSQDDTLQNSVAVASGEVNAVEVREPVSAADHELPPSVATTKPENGTCYGQINGVVNMEVDKKNVPNEGRNSSAALGMKNFDSESSCTQTSLGRDVNNDSDMCTNTKNVDADGNTMEQSFKFEKKLNLAGCEVVKDRNDTKSEHGATANNEHDGGYQNHSGCSNIVKAEEDININDFCMSNIKGVHHNDSTISKEPPHSALAEKINTAASDYQPCSTHHTKLKLVDRAHEDSILEEAQIIEGFDMRCVGFIMAKMVIRELMDPLIFAKFKSFLTKGYDPSCLRELMLEILGRNSPYGNAGLQILDRNWGAGWHLLSLLLATKPSQRISCLDALRHPFLCGPRWRVVPSMDIIRWGLGSTAMRISEEYIYRQPQRSRLAHFIDLMEMLNPHPKPKNWLELLPGKWRLLYCTGKHVGLTLRQPPARVLIGDVHLTVRRGPKLKADLSFVSDIGFSVMIGQDWPHNKAGKSGRLQVNSSFALTSGRRLYLKQDDNTTEKKFYFGPSSSEEALARKFTGKKWRKIIPFKEFPSSLPAAKLASSDIDVTMNLDDPLNGDINMARNVLQELRTQVPPEIFDLSKLVCGTYVDSRLLVLRGVNGSALLFSRSFVDRNTSA